MVVQPIYSSKVSAISMNSYLARHFTSVFYLNLTEQVKSFDVIF